MFACGPAFWVDSGPTAPVIVASLISNTTGSITVPAHNAGDLILICARAVASPDSAPGAFSGFSVITSNDPAFGLAASIQSAVDSSNTINSVSNPTGLTIQIIVIRSHGGTGAFGTVDTGSSTNPISLPNLTVSTSGLASVITFVFSNQAPPEINTPSGMNSIVFNTAFGGGDFASYEDQAVTSFTGLTTTYTSSARVWYTMAVEILPA